MSQSSISRPQLAEHITAGNIEPEPGSPRSIALRSFVSGACGASGLTTGTASFEPRAELPYHYYDCSEAITVLEGKATVLVNGRVCELGVFDCIHVPAGMVHAVRNESTTQPLITHRAFASSAASCTFVESPLSRARQSEHVTRFQHSAVYELSPGALFRDLFKGSLGSVGICGGYGRFQPGASLPCHFHEYDESITIVEGAALCLIQGNSYRVSDLDTAFVPVGKPHRFINKTDREMAMIWVYAGSEPERTLVAPDYCTGTLVWPGPDGYRRL